MVDFKFQRSIFACFISGLAKEVSRLRGLVGGGEIQDNDISVVSFPGSPGSFKWEGVQGSFSPLTFVKRISQKKDYDIALVGAFRRENDKEMELQALRDEIQASMKLVRQREDEIQSLKMRLRFREARIKRLETVASEKISAETHLLKEKEEHLKEIEVLRAQLLEALDWKFMHETDLELSSKSRWQSLVREENEFLKIQV
ncbi:hypothetical protein JHK87_024794 [Glycine soja]|nr:hypothetical protein JHK87_024794 [Glycine soja]